MAKKMEHFTEFPKELRDNVWEMALIPAPGVHFIKPNTDYNGTFLEPAAENAQYVHGPGIAVVSPFSAACEHARLSMVSREGKGRSLSLTQRVHVPHLQLSAAQQQLQSYPFDSPISSKYALRYHTLEVLMDDC